MDGFLIPLIHHWGGGIRPARRRAGGLKGASISDLNAKDGAITSIEGQSSCLVCCCVYVTQVSNIVSVSLKISLFMNGSCTPRVYTIKYISRSRAELCFHFGHFLQHTHNAVFKNVHFLAAWCSLAICSSSSLTWRTSPDWRGGLFCLFVYQGMKYSYCTLFWAEVI